MYVFVSKQPGSKWPGFLINRSGLPFDELTWNELWDFAGHLYPEAKVTFREIQSAPLLAEVPYPVPPSIRYGSCAYPVEQQSFGTGLSTEYFFHISAFLHIVMRKTLTFRPRMLRYLEGKQTPQLVKMLLLS